MPRDNGVVLARVRLPVVACLRSSQIFYGYGAGLRQNISFTDIKRMPVPVPPLDEQAAIVRFLDNADRCIRKCISAKRKLIDLLNEQKQAIAHRSITRGLDESVPLKPSGIAWLDQIPQHWEVRRLKSLVTESVAGPYGSSLTKSMYTQAGFRVYGQQQVIADNFEVGDYYIPTEQFREMQRYQVYAGDVLVTVMGTVGRVAVVPDSAERGIINPRLVRYRPDLTEVRPHWLQLVMQDSVAQAQLSEASKGTTMDGLNMGILGRLLLLKPPLVEQDAILMHVARKRQPINTALTRLERQIKRLHEYRTGLVTDVVTGKVDVREAAADLLDSSPDPEPDEDAVFINPDDDTGDGDPGRNEE
jgi:type I restriction enzyme S subunit